MKKVILNKTNEILGIVDVPELQTSIEVCNGYTIKRSIERNNLVYNTIENPVFPALNEDVFVGSETSYKEENDKPLNVRSSRLSIAKKYINSTAFKEAEYLSVDKNGVVDLS